MLQKLQIYNWFLLGHLFALYIKIKEGQVETNCKFLVKLILVTMQCIIFYHLSSIVYIASTHVQLAGCDNVKHIENECTKVPIL